VNVLAAAAGLSVAWPRPDCTGVDCHLGGTSEVDDDFPLLQAQIKSWSAPAGDDQFWRYHGLTEKRFNALAGPRRTPRYLFLVIVPREVHLYSIADDQGLLLSQAAYWLSLADSVRLADPRCDRRVRVRVPKANLLTVESLAKLCEES
jgi:hypothetical protein